MLSQFTFHCFIDSGFSAACSGAAVSAGFSAAGCSGAAALSRFFSNGLFWRCGLSRFFSSRVVLALRLPQVFQQRVVLALRSQQVFQQRVVLALRPQQVFQQRVVLALRPQQVFQQRVVLALRLQQVFQQRVVLELWFSWFFSCLFFAAFTFSSLALSFSNVFFFGLSCFVCFVITGFSASFSLAKNFCTLSVGFAPTDSQYFILSLLSVTLSGSLFLS